MMQSLQGMVKRCWSPNIYETRKSELSLMGLSLSIIHPSIANPSISSLAPSTQNESWINLLLCTSGSSQTHLSSGLYVPVSTLAPFNPLSTEQPDWSLKNVTQLTSLSCFKPSSSSSWNLERNPPSLPLMSCLSLSSSLTTFPVHVTPAALAFIWFWLHSDVWPVL